MKKLMVLCVAIVMVMGMVTVFTPSTANAGFGNWIIEKLGGHTDQEFKAVQVQLDQERQFSARQSMEVVKVNKYMTWTVIVAAFLVVIAFMRSYLRSTIRKMTEKTPEKCQIEIPTV